MAGGRRALGRWACLLFTVALVGACSDGGNTSGTSGTVSSTPASTGVPTTTTPGPTTTSAATPTTADAAVATPTTGRPPATVAAVPGAAFTGTVAPVTAADLPSSWRPGCPVAPDDLRLLRLSHWGFDDQPHIGSLVVAASVTEAVIDVFRTLYDQRFPIRRMELVDAYGSDDDASMAADNTSAFNCRPAVTTGPPHWSNHAYGLAIDVNPLENPYILGGQVLPPGGADYVDRSVYRQGMAVEGGVLTSAFDSVGWSWGGLWDSPDYQHFSSTGG